jgi:hypothetical protein
MIEIEQEYRLKARVPKAALEALKGKVPGDDTYDLLLDGTPARVWSADTELVQESRFKPPQKKRKLLCVYLPGVLADVMDECYGILSSIKLGTDNRGLAAGAPRIKVGTTRTRHIPIYSGILGAMDPVGPMQYCRLASWTGKNAEEWLELQPLWQEMARHFEEQVPLRFKAQVEYARKTPGEWVIPGTPYTTITINNTYSTGMHTDSGDLDAGFSCLAVARKGPWTGAKLVFPEWRVAAEMRHGDLILMDAHQWHGNTPIICECGDRLNRGPCEQCGSERVSVVAYYRTKMAQCGPRAEEDAKRVAYGERRLSEVEENDLDVAATTTRE